MPKSMTKAAGKAATVLFENEAVRVVELNWKKGLKIDMHTHPRYFVFGIAGIKYKSTSPDGKTRNRTVKKGEVVWSEPESHSVVSSGSGTALVVEIK